MNLRVIVTDNLSTDEVRQNLFVLESSDKPVLLDYNK